MHTVPNIVSIPSIFALAFVPLEPAISFSCLIAWKKYQLLTKPCESFIRLLKESCSPAGTENT